MTQVFACQSLALVNKVGAFQSVFDWFLQSLVHGVSWVALELLRLHSDLGLPATAGGLDACERLHGLDGG